jgi:hypothetical protein
MSNQRTAKLRVCARCKWVFILTHSNDCPVCGFASYGARWIYGVKAYHYAKTQKPWKDAKRFLFECSLEEERIKLSAKISLMKKYGAVFETTTPEYILKLTYE